MSEVPPKAQNNLERARAELLAFKQKNDLKDKKNRDPHWEAINLDELTDEEANLYLDYTKVKSLEDLMAVTKRLEARRQKVQEIVEKEKENNPDLDPYTLHSVSFIAWLANVINGKMIEFYRNEDFDRR